MKQYAVPLRLVTPHMSGQKVKDAQWLMAGNNDLAIATYKDGKADGDYGTLSAQATQRTKFWLGYPDASCDGTFGQVVYELLLGKRNLPPDYAARRKSRLSAKAPGLKALELAQKEIGYQESPPESNHNKFGVEYKFDRVPWCVIFESIMFKHAGFPSFRYAAVEAIHADAALSRNGLRLVRTPQAGDVAGYKFDGDPYAHTGFFVEWISQGKTFKDLSGNTGAASVSNGGEVAYGQRDVSVVSFFARYG
jgi:hypothetical protein